MLVDIPYLADWHKIGIHWQTLTDHKTAHKNACRVDYNYVVSRQIMIRKDEILCKSEYHHGIPYTITQINMNDTIRVQRESKLERHNIRKVTPYFTVVRDDGDN